MENYSAFIQQKTTINIPTGISHADKLEYNRKDVMEIQNYKLYLIDHSCGHTEAVRTVEPMSRHEITSGHRNPAGSARMRRHRQVAPPRIPPRFRQRSQGRNQS